MMTKRKIKNCPASEPICSVDCSRTRHTDNVDIVESAVVRQCEDEKKIRGQKTPPSPAAGGHLKISL